MWRDRKWGPAGSCLWPCTGGHRRGPPSPASACGCRPSGGTGTGTSPPAAADTAGTGALQSQPLVPPAPMFHQGRSRPLLLTGWSLRGQQWNTIIDIIQYKQRTDYCHWHELLHVLNIDYFQLFYKEIPNSPHWRTFTMKSSNKECSNYIKNDSNTVKRSAYSLSLDLILILFRCLFLCRL